MSREERLWVISWTIWIAMLRLTCSHHAMLRSGSFLGMRRFPTYYWGPWGFSSRKGSLTNDIVNNEQTLLFVIS